MKNKILLFLLLVFSLNSCSNLSNLKKIKNELKESNKFNNILALKYTRYSDILYRNKDYTSSKHFSKLGIKAYKNNIDILFNIDKKMQNINPQMLADYHFLFNCWMYYETENKNLGEAAICRDAFIKLDESIKKNSFTTIDKKILKNDQEKKFESKNEELKYLNIVNKTIMDIYFDFDSYKLNNDALDKIGNILNYLNSLDSFYNITIVGHTDRIGKPIYNKSLARKRANTVYNILIKNGVPRDSINIESLSSQQPNIITKQNEKSQLNRRVEIIIELDIKNQDFNPEPR